MLVTGGGGFLGARLVHRLAALSSEVHLIVRPTTDLWRLGNLADRVRLHRCDLADAGAMDAVVRAIGPRVVFHTAATGAHVDADDLRLFRDNVLATSHLLHATAGLSACRVVHTASSLETGPRPVPITEDDPPAPRVPFAAAKAAASLLVRGAAALGRDVVTVRPFAIYGPGEPDRRLIPTAIRAALTGTSLRLTAPGYTRDLVFVEDVVDAYLAAATTPGIEGEVFNIATGRPTPNEETVRVIETLVGRAIVRDRALYPTRPTDTTFWCADVSKASRVLGWQAAHDLEQGLEKTVAWYRTAVHA